MYKAYQGPNGWYVAWERADGSHRQPPSGEMTTSQARSEARRRNRVHDGEVAEWPRDDGDS